jgi:hypothetical protein
MKDKDFHNDEFYDDYIMGRLSEDDEDLFEEHLLFCERCRQEIEFRESLTAGLDSIKDAGQSSKMKNKKSRRGMYIRLGIAATLVFIVGYTFIKLFITQNDSESPIKKEVTIEVPDSPAEQQKTVIITDSTTKSEISHIEMLAEAFTTLPMFENAINNQVRANGITIVSPINSMSFKSDENIEFVWENVGKHLMLAIFNNKGKLIFEEKIKTPYRLDASLQPGLYYWQLETEDEALCTYKFLIK